MSRNKILRLILIMSLLFSAGTVMARDFLNMNECVVDADTVIEGTLFVLCQDLRIFGTVEGDVIGAAVRSEIDGRIGGNVYLVSSQLDIRGHVRHDLLFGGVVLRLNPPAGNVAAENDNETPPPTHWVGGSLKAISLSTTLFEGTIINDGILSAGYQLIINGDVQNEMTFWGSALLINNTIDGDVYTIVGNPEAESRTLETLLIPFQFDVELINPGLIITQNSRIDGNLYYTSPVEATIRGEITGDEIYQETVQMIIPTLEEPGSLTIYFSQLGREFTTLLAIGAVAVIAAPEFLQFPLRNLRTRPFSSFSVGMLAFLLSFPVVLIVAVLSVVIIFILQLVNLDGLVVAVGIVLGLVNLGGVSLFYFVAIFVARALVGLALGRFILRVLYRHRDGTVWLLLELAIGLLLLSAVVSLPVIGLIFNAGALFMGLGTILNVLLMQFRRWREASPTPAATWYSPSPAATRRRVTIGEGSVPKVLPTMNIDEQDMDDDSAEDDIEEEVIHPLPPPAVDDPYPLVGPGMTNLPDGFDFGFFTEHTPDNEPDNDV